MITLFNIRPKGFNIGNDAINFALRELIYKSFGRVVNIIEIPAISYYESQVKAGLTAKTINEINRYGDGIIVGGGNLYENNELAVDLNALQALDVPLMLFSLSRGQIYNRKLELARRTDTMPDHIIKSLHKSAKYSVARDSATLNHLQSLACDHAVFGGCPTMMLCEALDRLPNLPRAEVPGVLISVRSPAQMNLPAYLQSKVQSDIEGIIDNIRDRGYKRVRILCNDTRDVEFAAIFRATRCVDFVYTADVYWYLALLRHAELVVSYRLHAWLPCISFGTPTIPISYDERAIGLAEDIGYGDWNINMAVIRDVIREVGWRMDHLDTLETLKKDNSLRWNELIHNQNTQMKAFADDVSRFTRKIQMHLRSMV